MSLRNEKKQQTREDILAAATRLLAERGFEATTMRDLATAANLSYQTLYNYFPTKADIVQAVLSAKVETAAAQVSRLLETFDNGVLKTLNEFTDISLSIISPEDKVLWREATLDTMRQQHQATELYNLTSRVRHQLIFKLLHHAHLSGELVSTVDCEVLTEAIYATGEYCFLEFLLQDEMAVADMAASSKRLIAVIVTPYLNPSFASNHT